MKLCNKLLKEFENPTNWEPDIIGIAVSAGENTQTVKEFYDLLKEQGRFKSVDFVFNCEYNEVEK